MGPVRRGVSVFPTLVPAAVAVAVCAREIVLSHKDSGCAALTELLQLALARATSIVHQAPSAIRTLVLLPFVSQHAAKGISLKILCTEVTHRTSNASTMLTRM